MNKQVHHIQKQQLIMEFSSEEKSIEWNKNASCFYFDKLLPLLDNIFTRHFSEKQVFYLEKLELDLGTIGERFLYENFLEKLENELRLILKGIKIDKKNSSGYLTAKKKEGIDINGSIKSPIENTLIVKDKKEHILFCFYYFIDHGVLPWNSNFISLDLLEAAIKREIGYKTVIAHKEFQIRLKKQISIRRLYFQFSDRFWGKIVRLSYPAELSLLYDLRNELLKCLLPKAKDTKSKKEIKWLLAADILDWLGAAAPADTKDWPRQYILGVIEKRWPFVKSIGETTLLDFFTQELQKSQSAQQHQILLKNIVAFYENEIASTELSKQENAQKAQNFDKNSDPEAGNDLITTPISTSGKTENPKSSTVSNRDIERFENYEDSSIREFAISVDKKNEEIALENQQLHVQERPQQRGSSQTDPTEREEADKKEFLKGNENIIISSRDEVSNACREAESSNANTPEGSIRTIRTESGETEEKDVNNDQISHIETEVLAEYYIHQAGVILVWPYLKSLYNHLEYLNGKEFKDIHYQQRAVHLLSYIATGHEQCEEHTLVFAKFLCGWPLQMPIIKKIALTKKEKSESEQMIQQLILNWAVLKRTSVEGVRSSFFTREGKLFKEEEGWRLFVAQKSYDMLLDHLPYTISIVKLPWMEEILKVDWA